MTTARTFSYLASALTLGLGAVGCTSSGSEAPLTAEAAQSAPLQSCAKASVAGATVTLETTTEATWVLHFAWPKKDVGDPMLASSLHRDVDVVFPPATDLAAVRRAIDGRLFTAILGGTTGVDAQVDAFRARLAEAYLENLRCAERPTTPEVPEAAAVTPPPCTSRLPATSPRLSLSRGPDVTPAPTTPERRHSFLVSFEMPSSQVAGGATLTARRTLTMERLGPDARDAIETLFFDPPMGFALASHLVERDVTPAQYDDLRESLVCE